MRLCGLVLGREVVDVAARGMLRDGLLGGGAASCEEVFLQVTDLLDVLDLGHLVDVVVAASLSRPLGPSRLTLNPLLCSRGCRQGLGVSDIAVEARVSQVLVDTGC